VTEWSTTQIWLFNLHVQGSTVPCFQLHDSSFQVIATGTALTEVIVDLKYRTVSDSVSNIGMNKPSMFLLLYIDVFLKTISLNHESMSRVFVSNW
jgi:hypothetical protein